MIHFAPPENFTPKFHVACCYVRHGNDLLWLLRNDDKNEGNKWGIPGGKLDADEAPRTAVARELAEETGIVAQPHDFQELRTAYVRYPDYDFIFSAFLLDVAERPQVQLELREHKTHAWATIADALTMPLVMGNDELLKCYFLEYGSR